MATATITTRPPLPDRFTMENRSEFIRGRTEIIAFLSRKWARELDYRLIKELWAFTDNRIAVRFAYEWHDDSGHWYRSYGNENWEFNADGLMAARFASINDLPISASDRKYHWPFGRRPDNHPGLSDLGLLLSGIALSITAGDISSQSRNIGVH